MGPEDVNQIAVLLNDLWPSMKATQTQAKAITLFFSRYGPGEVVDGIQFWAGEHPGARPDFHEGRGWQDIRDRLSQDRQYTGKRRDAWTLGDEHELRTRVTWARVQVNAGNLPPENCTERYILRRVMERTPAREERLRMTELLNQEVEAANARAKCALLPQRNALFPPPEGGWDCPSPSEMAERPDGSEPEEEIPRNPFEASELAAHRAHYASHNPERWPWPGNAAILECIREGGPTPLQKHCMGYLGHLATRLAGSTSEDLKSRQRARDSDRREQARQSLVREQRERMIANKKRKPPKSWEQITRESTDREMGAVVPGHVLLRDGDGRPAAAPISLARTQPAASGGDPQRVGEAI